MSKVIIIVVLLIGVILYFNRDILKSSKQNKQPLSGKDKFRITVTALLVVMVVLAITGRIHWLGVVITAMIPMVRKLLPLLIRFSPLIKQYLDRYRSAGVSSGNTSAVSSQVLSMVLDHDTGEFDGEVLQGALKGKKLSRLTEPELITLTAYCGTQDQESVDLILAYLERRFGQEWVSSHVDGNTQEGSDSTAVRSHDMTNEEACAILGLSKGASKDEIIKAHRKLMQKVHPDRGGNDYLATKINLAKDHLVG